MSYYVGIMSSFQHACEEFESKRVYVFGPCELLFFNLICCLLDLSCCECHAISLYFMYCSVNGSVCLVCCVRRV